MHNIKITILMAIKDYSHGKLKQAVESILTQSYQNVEIIIKHNGSPRELSKLRKDFSHEKITLLSLEDTSLGHALNQAMKEATGDIITVFHHDDTYVADALKTVISHLDDSIWYFGLINYFTDGVEQRVVYDPNPTLSLMREVNAIPQPACFFKKEAYTEVGPFDESFKLLWDYDYWIRMMKKWQPKYIPSYLANYYLTETSITWSTTSTAKLLMHEEIAAVKEKHFSQSDT